MAITHRMRTSKKSVTEPTQIIDRVQSVNNVQSESHKSITFRRGKKKSFAEIVRG